MSLSFDDSCPRVPGERVLMLELRERLDHMGGLLAGTIGGSEERMAMHAALGVIADCIEVMAPGMDGVRLAVTDQGNRIAASVTAMADAVGQMTTAVERMSTSIDTLTQAVQAMNSRWSSLAAGQRALAAGHRTMAMVLSHAGDEPPGAPPWASNGTGALAVEPTPRRRRSAASAH